MRILQHPQQVVVTEKKQCTYCGSETVQFVEFDRVQRRLDERKILATEIWVCGMCGKEFERAGTLYSPQDANRIKLRTAVIIWCGYTVGSLLALTLLV